MAGTNEGNNGKGIVLTYIARRLQRSLVTRGCRSVGYACVKNATEPSSMCKHDVTIDSDVGDVVGDVGLACVFDHRLLEAKELCYYV